MQRLIERSNHEHRPLVLALLLSLLVHALLLSLTFGGDERGLPGLVVPWRDRRIEVPALRILLVPPPATPARPAARPAAAPRVIVDPPVARRSPPTPTPTAPASPARHRRESAVANAPAAGPTAQADAMRNALPSAAPADVPVPARQPDRAAPMPTPQPAVTDAAPPAVAPSVVPAEPLSPMAVVAVAVAPSASSPQTVTSGARDSGDAALKAQREEAVRQEEARVEAARLDAERQELERQATAREEARREAAARQEAARAEAARREAEREEAARQAAARQEVQREAQREEAARQDVARTEAARREAEREQAARQASARQEARRAEAAQDEAAKREAVLRAIGRQLDEEAARREAAPTAAAQPNTLPYSLSTARRVRLWGRTDPNAELVQYAEAWARKIQFNTAVDTVRDLAKRPHAPPTVTVAVRSDGSVESVTFFVSSGVAEVDEAIRRIIESQRPYPAFPPALARDFDVIEIRRSWHFDAAVRLQ